MGLNDSQGCSTTKTPGQFAYDEFTSKFTGRRMVQWDYRDSKGNLFSGVAKSVEAAREVARKQSGEPVEG
jgi:hypothetical protein